MNKKILSFVGLIVFLSAAIIFAVYFPKIDSQASTIIWQLRVPRIFLAFLVGAGLSCCGVVFQAMLRNALAEPYTLGVSSGAALGAALAIMFNLGVFFITTSSFLGSLVTIFVLYAIASRKHFDNNTMILAGVALSLLFSSLVLLVFAVARKEGVHSAVIWLMGDLSSARPEVIKAVAFFILAGIFTLIAFARDLDIICLGDEKAGHLGLNVILTKRILFVVASIITGAAISAAGIIGFVGLIIPHIARFLFGVNHRRLLVTSAILGAAFLIICDTVSRTIILPLELPVGVVTGICGGLFFLGLLVKAKRWSSL